MHSHTPELKNVLSLVNFQILFQLLVVIYSADSIEQLQNVMNSELKNLNDWLIIANKLSLNSTKSEFMIIGTLPRIT